jgi:hypothetical protein
MPSRREIEDDDIIQATIMQQALIVYPANLTVDETLLDYLDGPGEPPERDAALIAIRDLVCAGLLRRHGEFLIPTRPVVRFNELPSAGT